MAVDDNARAVPKINEVCVGSPIINFDIKNTKTVVINICKVPVKKTSVLIFLRCDIENSKPIVNIKKTTPNSAISLKL